MKACIEADGIESRMRSQGYYCILQYCPHPGRDERINVGLFLVDYEEGRGSFRALPVHHPLGPGYDTRRAWKALGCDGSDKWKEGTLRIMHSAQITYNSLIACENLNELTVAASKQCNSIRVTPPRSVALEDRPAQFEQMFKELVEFSQ